MRLSGSKSVPLTITVAVVALGCLLQLISDLFPSFSVVQRLEWMSYDWRTRLAYDIKPGTTDRLAFVNIGDETISLFSEGKLGPDLQFGLYWPRHVYGRVIRELKAEGAKAVALDVLFGERRRDHPAIRTSAGVVGSDVFFQQEMLAASNVLLAATRKVVPHPFFRDSAAGFGDIANYRDADGVLRRIQTFNDLRLWHPAILDEARLNNWDLSRAVVQSNRIIFVQNAGGPLSLPVNAQGYYDPTDLAMLTQPNTGAVVRPPVVRLAKAYEDVRLWHLGLVLAAQELELDLAQAEVDLAHGKITLAGRNGVKRVLPVDSRGRMLINWNLGNDSLALATESFETMVARDIQRQWGSNVVNRFEGKLVVLGSTATGNDLADRGATPLERDTFLTSNHWNVANSLLTGEFIKTCSTWLACLLIAALGAASWALTTRLRVVYAALAVATSGLAYTGIAVLVFVHYTYWLPLILPVGTGLLTYFSMISYQAVFEQTERRRVRNIFSKIVSPNVVQELLKADNLSLVGTRREVTVLFTDVRGFTAMTDLMQSKIEAYTRKHNLSPQQAREYADAQSQEVVQTVNSYLGLIADTIKKFDGTFDKYIGDCVMAFWGAPTPHERHALDAVHTAIESQRAIHAFNQERALENKRRASENLARTARGEEPLPMLTLLSLGAGINTGVVTAGLMGSDAHIVNYTVFGREVNLAARLESISGRGHILIGETTYLELQRDDPALAATCIPWEPTRLKGFLTPVKIFEVPWQNAKAQPLRLEEAA